MAKWEASGVRPDGVVTIRAAGIEVTGKTIDSAFKAFINEAHSSCILLPKGWEDEAWLSIRAKWPKAVTRKKKSSIREMLTVPVMKSFILFTMRRIGKKDLVHRELAYRRAEICRNCPKHEEIVGCKKCVAALKELVDPPEILPDLQGCGVCQCFMVLKVWLPTRYLRGQDKEFQFPSGCWIPAELGASSTTSSASPTASPPPSR